MLMLMHQHARSCNGKGKGDDGAPRGRAMHASHAGSHTAPRGCVAVLQRPVDLRAEMQRHAEGEAAAAREACAGGSPRAAAEEAAGQPSKKRGRFEPSQRPEHLKPRATAAAVAETAAAAEAAGTGWRCTGSKHVGRRARRLFARAIVSLGTVAAWVPAGSGGDNTALWRVLYDDGDEEDLELPELTEALAREAQRYWPTPAEVEAAVAADDAAKAAAAAAADEALRAREEQQAGAGALLPPLSLYSDVPKAESPFPLGPLPGPAAAGALCDLSDEEDMIGRVVSVYCSETGVSELPDWCLTVRRFRSPAAAAAAAAALVALVAIVARYAHFCRAPPFSFSLAPGSRGTAAV